MVYFSPLKLEIQTEFTLSLVLKDRGAFEPGFLEQVFLWVTLKPREAVAVICALPFWTFGGCSLLLDCGPAFRASMSSQAFFSCCHWSLKFLSFIHILGITSIPPQLSE